MLRYEQFSFISAKTRGKTTWLETDYELLGKYLDAGTSFLRSDNGADVYAPGSRFGEDAMLAEEKS